MSTTGTVATAAPTLPQSRLLRVVRMQFINTQTFVWVPALVLGGAWAITLLIYLTARATGGDDVLIGGGSQAPLWYFLVIGVQAMTLTFPFSQAMSLTRREFYLGSLIAAAVSGLGMAAAFVLLGLLERATNGYGIDGYFAYLDWVWVDGPLAAGLIYFICVMLFFVVGFLSATIYQRFGTFRLVLGMIVIALALVGLGALITWQQAWPELWTWILQTGALGLSLWAALATAVLATLSYLALRRLPA